MSDSDTARMTFGTVVSAMITPMTQEGEIDFASAVKVVKHLIDTGHDGILVSGTTGESPTTTDGEKSELIRVVKNAASSQATVFAGVGTNDTRHSVKLAKEAADAGADGLLIVTPYYSKPSQEGLFQHFVRVAESTDLPCMVYDIPGRSGIAIAESTLERLGEHPQILAVKDASGDPGAAVRKIQQSGLAWYSGDDALNLALLAAGAVGVVSVTSHVTGEAWRTLVDAAAVGDLNGARDAFISMNGVIDAIMGGGQGVAMAKAALELAGILPTRTTRLPVTPATQIETGHLREAMNAAGLL